MKLRELIEKHGAFWCIISESGDGSANSAGRFVHWDADADKKYGDTEMLPVQHFSLRVAGVACSYSSDWIVDGEGDNPHRYRIYL